MTTSESQPGRWAYPPAPAATARSGPRHAYAPTSDTPPASHYPPASAYPSPSSIYRPRLPTRSGVRRPRKNNRVRNIAFGIVALLIASAVAIVVVRNTSNGSTAKSRRDAAFINSIHNGMPRTKKLPDAEITKVGHAVCDTLDAKQAVKAVVAMLTSKKYRYTTIQSGIYMRASIATYCPQYSYLVSGH